MKAYELVLILLFSFQTILEGQQDGFQTLLVAEYERDQSGSADFTWLTAYKFKHGQFVYKDTILGAPTHIEGIPGPYVQFGGGDDFIYQNRYVISRVGNVIDLKTREIILEESDEFVEANDNLLLFHRANIFTGTGYLTFDLETLDYSFIDNKPRPMSNQHLSPNREHLIEIDQSSLPYHLKLIEIEQEKLLSKRMCGNGTKLLINAGPISHVPVFWIDNAHALFAKFQDRRIEIVRVTLSGSEDRNLAAIENVPLASSNAHFFLDVEGDILFSCAKGVYKVDLDNETVELQFHWDRGNGFKIEIEGGEMGSEIYYQEELIGKFECSEYDAQTSNGSIALEYWDLDPDRWDLAGIKIWTTSTQEWLTIDLPLLCGIIGWVKGSD